MSGVPPEDAFPLRALAPPRTGAAAGLAPGRHRVPLDPEVAGAAVALARSRGWREDAIAAAAWALVVARFTGASHWVLRECAEGGITHERRGAFAPGAPGDELLAAIDAARSGPGEPAGEGDDAWCADPSLPSGRPLVAEIDGDASAPGLHLRFDRAVFDETGIALLGSAFARAFEALARDPAIEVGAIDLVGPTDRERVSAWNPRIEPIDGTQSVVSAFRRQVARRGERTAIASDDGELGYAELDRRSDALAGCLAADGVARGDVIGLALERSPDALVAVLGILKAGAAYLPIDVRYPAERVAFMLRDAKARRVIANRRDAALFPAGTTVLDAEAWCAADGGGPVPPAPAADDLAYVMYTSGSTGEPKGIRIRHRSILRLVLQGGFADLDERAVVLHAAPLGFDASTFEIWGPLLTGGRCVLHAEAVPTGRGLARAIERHGVKSAWLTAALFNAVVDHDARDLAGLEELLTGGEALSVPHVRKALAALPSTQLINGYGPTECTTFTATHRIPRELPEGLRSIPIGRPIGGTAVHILGPGLEPLPAGLVGELCVGGPGLAAGYLDRPALDRERFVESALGPDGRLYRTGDLAHWLPDGTIEYVGRRDGQVKIRGFRIETGEVEAALAAHPVVRSCAVVAREAPGGTRLVAYVVPAGRAPSPAALRAHLAERLPEFMVPASFVMLDSLPVTANGKLDRQALPAPEARRPELAQPYLAPAGPLEEAVCRVFADLLGIDRAGRRDNFFELGGNSLAVLEATERLAREAGREVPTTVFFADPTPAAIAAWIETGGDGAADAHRLAKPREAATSREPIAIVAMSGRFPGAASVEAFWENLREGRESITRFAPGELDPSLPASLTADPDYVPARGVVEGVEQFDAAFFGISPLEARLMDPQQRLFLELCWECLERAGFVPDATTVPVGVFGGMYNSTYGQKHVAAHPGEVARLGEFQAMLGVEKDYIATRTAHRLNLTGPAISVHTACSTSLVAIVQAVTSLRAGQCDLALAGGASITCPPRSGYRHEEGAMLSPDGHTRTFDENAQGTVFSDGAAVVLLKRLSDAIADGDTIHAVIRGAAVNNDGGAKASFTAPSVDGQAAVIAAALADAGVPPQSVSYVEAHGTATPLGDPVEIEALARAYGRDLPRPIRIGSLKSNVGHLVIAAGAAGVIKAASSLAHERLPPTLHFRAPNPKLGLDRTPFVVNAALHPWPRAVEPRRAGVSAFGVGGTNAHVILEEAPLPGSRPPAGGPQLLLLSARTPAALAAAAGRLADHLERHPDTDLADAAHTLREGRKAFAERACVVAASAAEAIDALRRTDSPRRAAGRAAEAEPPVAFLFPGQGSQYAAMGKALHASEPDFRAAFDACFAALGDEAGAALRERIFAGDPQALAQTALTQPALFALEYALTTHWMARGVRPSALIGHSVGEFVAAALAGVMSPGDAMRLVAKRGELMQAMPPGAMLAVRAGAQALRGRLPKGVEIAAENSPALTVVAGPSPDIEAFRAALEAEGTGAKALVTSHAFHSAMMDDAVPVFERHVRAVSLAAPSVPIWSTVHARPLAAQEATDPAYWARHLREPVRFGPAVAALMASPVRVLLECGPRATLGTLARQQGVKDAPAACASLADSPENERESLALAGGRLWTLGVPVDLAPRLARAPRRVTLPTYPFERQRHWLEAAPARPAAAAPALPVPLAAPAPQPAPAPAAAPPSASGAESAMTAPAATDRRPALVSRLRALLEDISGLDLAEADASAPLAELGLDSLTLTQAAIQVKQAFKVNVTFRQLMENYRSIDALAAHLDGQMPAQAPPPRPRPRCPRSRRFRRCPRCRPPAPRRAASSRS